MMDFDELKRLLADAEPTPWNSPKWRSITLHPNNLLIVAAVNALPDLIAELERLRADVRMAGAEVVTHHSIMEAQGKRIKRLKAALREYRTFHEHDGPCSMCDQADAALEPAK
jgi:hypothetical protein